MDMVKRVLPSKEGIAGWDVQKLHEMFHLIHDTRFGAPMNFDSGTGKKYFLYY
jgi:hypothetical protein